MKIIVFCGPTLSVAEARQVIDADFRPPAKHGDIISCVYTDQPDVIILIDGVFIHDLTVWHSELNEVINQGVTVYGASAMGAIRAAEMASWGMRGVGEVFKLFLDGTVESDDEVFFDYAFEKGAYLKKTLSIVNLRGILADGVRASMISFDQCIPIIETAKALYYKERTPGAIFSACRAKEILTIEESEALMEFILDSLRDIQKEDALLCLETVRDLSASDLDTTKKNYEYDLFFEALFERDRGVKNGDGYHPFYHIANDYLLHGKDTEAVNHAALNRKICVLIADHFKVDASEKEIAAEKKRFIQKRALKDNTDYLSWLKDNDLTENELHDLMTEQVKIGKMQEWYRSRLGFAKNTRYLLEELKLNDQYTFWKQKSLEIYETLKGQLSEIRRTFSENDVNTLLTLFLKHNERSWAYAPYHYMKNTGTTPSALRYMLAREKTYVDTIARGIYKDA